MPAAPAMPTAEWSSVMKTFSMSRWAIVLPAVARRSPAMITPSAKVSATIVVPWGTTTPDSAPGRTAPPPTGSCPSAKRPGSRCGAFAVTKSVNDDGPGARYAPMPGVTGGRNSMVGCVPLLVRATGRAQPCGGAWVELVRAVLVACGADCGGADVVYRVGQTPPT